MVSTAFSRYLWLHSSFHSNTLDSQTSYIFITKRAYISVLNNSYINMLLGQKCHRWSCIQNKDIPGRNWVYSPKERTFHIDVHPLSNAIYKSVTDNTKAWIYTLMTHKVFICKLLSSVRNGAFSSRIGTLSFLHLQGFFL